jgi:hypothetical protein
MTIEEFIVSKFPSEEREELTQLLLDRLSELSPQDKGFAIAQHRLDIQDRIRKHGVMITEDQAYEKMHDELVQAVPRLQRLAMKFGNASLYRDLEKYGDVPEVALFKNYHLTTMVQAARQIQQQKQEKRVNNLFTSGL